MLFVILRKGLDPIFSTTTGFEAALTKDCGYFLMQRSSLISNWPSLKLVLPPVLVMPGGGASCRRTVRVSVAALVSIDRRVRYGFRHSSHRHCRHDTS